MRSTSERAWPLAAAACLFAASLALYWPGIAMYDTVAQYGQVLSGQYDDWHPPVMARLWSMLAPLGPGAAPMLVLQFAGYWVGLGLIGAALAGSGRIRAGWAVIAVGACPVFLGWQAAVLKDAQMVGVLLAAVGLVAWFRSRGRAMPTPALLGVAVLAGYATLVRANAAFACVPLAVLLADSPRRPAARVALAVAATAAVLLAASPINHRLLGAPPTGVEKTQALYDLAGIAVRVDDPAATGLQPGEVAALRARGCVKAFFWDPLGDPAHCGPVMDRLRAETAGQLYPTLARATLLHPIAYVAHRLAHLNSTERWLVPLHWPSAAPPADNEPNTLGLTAPRASAKMLQRVARVLVETPLGWPFAWAIVATALLLGLRQARGWARDTAVALLGSALALEASFAVISIASDLRYHLWPMIATALAAVLAIRQADRRLLLGGAAVLAVMLLAALVARLLLPMPPQSYAAMLG